MDGIFLEKVVARFGARKVPNDSAAAAVAAVGFSVRRLAAEGESLFDFALPAAEAAASGERGISAVIAATFSSERRFPALSVRIASALGLPASTPAFDLQMACSAYPYAVYLAGRMASDLGGKVLVVDADIQSRLVDASDDATALVMDDAATATVVSVRAHREGDAGFSFLSSYGEALECPQPGPVRMDGFKVFSFVAKDVVALLRSFGNDFEMFVPHRANMYMVRQLAKSLGLADKLLAPQGEFANPGSSSIPATLALAGHAGRALIAGFGAGLSASAGIVSLPGDFRGGTV